MNLGRRWLLGSAAAAGLVCPGSCASADGIVPSKNALLAVGGFMIIAPLPDTSHLLLEASSHAGASGGRKAISFL